MLNTEKEKIILNKSINAFTNLKSDYFLQKIFDNTTKKVLLQIIKIIREYKKDYILILILIKNILKYSHQLN